MRHTIRLASAFVVCALVIAAGPGVWSPAGDCTPLRYEHNAGRLADGRVLVTGGQGEIYGSNLNSAKLFQAPSTWTDAASMNVQRSTHTQTLLPDGRVLITGGRTLTINPDTSGYFTYLKSAEIYAPASNTWTTVAPMNEARGSHRATLLANGKVLVSGGISPTTLSSAEIYDPAANTWTTVASMVYARYLHAAVLMQDGSVLVAGTYFGGLPSEKYDPSANTWSYAGYPSISGPDNMAFLLPDGRVLAFGGLPNLYDPATGTWTLGAFMPMGTNDLSADLLLDGRLIVTGGQNGAAMADVRIYDPVANAWTLDASMASVRTQHRTVTLPDGRVLVAGGFKGSGMIAATELYAPASTDTTPPVITAPASVVAEQTSPAGAAATIAVSALDAVDGVVPVTSDALATFPPGLTTVHFTALDHAGNAAHASTDVYVVDTTAPSIALLKASPAKLWPPNGKLVPVALTVSATDAADPAPRSVIRSVTSNDAPHGGPADWVLTGNLTVSLRAEKNRCGTTRVYTIVVRCTDASGNFSDKSLTVSVKP
jgi:hypothetical protein